MDLVVSIAASVVAAATIIVALYLLFRPKIIVGPVELKLPVIRGTKGQLSVRDFVYLDTEKLKSIYAQLSGGLVLETQKKRGDEKSAGASAGLDVPMVGQASLGGNIVWRNEETETSTLHDNIYNKVEETLTKNQNIVSFGLDVRSEDWVDNKLPTLLTDTSFFIASGRILVHDYSFMGNFIGNYDKLLTFVTKCGLQEDIALIRNNKTLNEKQRNDRIQKLVDKRKKEVGEVEDWLMEGISDFIESFYKDLMVVNLFPFPDRRIKIVGYLKKEWLRYQSELLLSEYGSAPMSDWTMMGQIANLPSFEEAERVIPSPSSNEIRTAFEATFTTLEEFEKLVYSIEYPTISVVPISVYRGSYYQPVALDPALLNA